VADASTTCPPGTGDHDGLCLSGDAVSVALADTLRTRFEADQLSAVIAGVWHDGEPVLFGALGDSMPGVPAAPDVHIAGGPLFPPGTDWGYSDTNSGHDPRSHNTPDRYWAMGLLVLKDWMFLNPGIPG